MKNLMDGHNSGVPAKHLNPDQIICCGLHVDAEANIMFAVVSTANLLLNPIRALMTQMGRELYGDATHKVSQQLVIVVNISQLGVADVQGRGHLWGLCIHPHGHESADMYRNFHLSLFIAMSNVVDNLMLCDSRSCKTCSIIHGAVEHPVVKEMLERPRVATKFIDGETSDEIFIDFEWETVCRDSGEGF